MRAWQREESRISPLVLVSVLLPFELWKQCRSGNLGESCEFGFGSFETGATEEDSGDVRLAVRSLGLEHRRSRLKPCI